MGILGGGFKYAVSPTQGLRAELRLNVSSRSGETTLDASPSVTQQAPIFAIATSGIPPAIQFSNSLAIGRESSLSGPAISGMTTFEDGGTDARVGFSVGYYFRF